MADPLTLLAIGALVYAGKKLSEEPEKTVEKYEAPKNVYEQDYSQGTAVMNTLAGRADPDPGVSSLSLQRPNKIEQPSFGDVAFMKHVNGEPVVDFRNRMYMSGKMNNLSPVDKTLVGPGLGVGPDTPAVGGFQQLYRVNPNNVGAYRLTTLPGRSGPAGDVTGGRQAVVGELTHNMPAKTAFLPTRRPEVPGRAQGQGGSLSGVRVRAEHERTKKTTNRSETTYRGDGLGYGPAKRFISATAQAQDPTRNKGDLNVLQYGHLNNPTPGIHSFHGGYTESAAVKMMSEGRSNDQLMKYGFRPEDRRGKINRAGNAGRMNVRADPLNQHGMVTSVRSDTSRVDGWTGPGDASYGQTYVKAMYDKFNQYKGNENTRDLDIAKNQLMSNPLNHPLSI
jgi:hypothetical protein